MASTRWEGSEDLYKRMFAEELEELHQSFAAEYERDAQQDAASAEGGASKAEEPRDDRAIDRESGDDLLARALLENERLKSQIANLAADR